MLNQVEVRKNYYDVQQEVIELFNDNCEFFIKSIISCELGIEDEDMLDSIWNYWLNNDIPLLSDGIRELAQIND